MVINSIRNNGVALLLLSVSIFAVAKPNVAVTELAWEEQLSGYFTETDVSYNKQSYSTRDDGNRSVKRTTDLEINQVTSYETKFNRGHLQKFVNDIKGALIKSGSYGVVQGAAPVKAESTQELFGILQRIKKGDFKSADYVLFGTLTAVDMQIQDNELAGSSSRSIIFEIQVVADFSLINTESNEVIAAFSAIGDGSDVKLIKGESKVRPSFARALRASSKSLSEDVILNIQDQTL